MQIRVNASRLVPTNTLQVGDVIRTYGCILRVRQVQVSTVHGQDNGPTHANLCEFMGTDADSECPSLPEAWRANWNQQGNSLARTELVTLWAEA